MKRLILTMIGRLARKSQLNSFDVLLLKLLYLAYNTNFNDFLKKQRSRFIALFLLYVMFISMSFVREEEHSKIFLDMYLEECRRSSDVAKSMYKKAVDSIQESPDYFRYKIFKDTGILVPGHVQDRHLSVMSSCVNIYDIPIGIFVRLIKSESSFDSMAVSSSGAFGYMQLLPSTYDAYYNSMDLIGGRSSENNIKIGSKLLSDLYVRFKSWDLALASYNIGPYEVSKTRTVPERCKQYVKKIMQK